MSEGHNNWHLKLFQKSILKQAKLKSILSLLNSVQEKTCLDLGGDNGVISYHLRAKGGTWYSADLEDEAVDSIKSLVNINVYKIDGEKTPFNTNFFDTVVIIDFLEHIHTDKIFINELYRIIKPDGVLIINVPHIKKISSIKYLRNLLGLTAEKHGHVREGYNIIQLKELLGNKFEVIQYKAYSKFFTELIDVMISFAYTIFKGKQEKQSTKGVLVTEKDFKKNDKLFKIYSVIYPFMWIISKLDCLLFFTEGHSLIIKAKRSP